MIPFNNKWICARANLRVCVLKFSGYHSMTGIEKELSFVAVDSIYPEGLIGSTTFSFTAHLPFTTSF